MTSSKHKTARELLAEYPIVIEVRVSWGDMDAFEHVNNTKYFRYFEDCRIAFFEAIGITLSGVPEGIGPIISEMSCKYRAPVTFPDILLVGARVGQIDGDRFVLEHGVVSTKTGVLVARGAGTVVSYDYTNGNKVDLPDDWLAAMERLDAIVKKRQA